MEKTCSHEEELTTICKILEANLQLVNLLGGTGEVGRQLGGHAEEVAEARGGSQPRGWRRGYSLPPSLSHHSDLNMYMTLYSLAGLGTRASHQPSRAASLS